MRPRLGKLEDAAAHPSDSPKSSAQRTTRALRDNPVRSVMPRAGEARSLEESSKLGSRCRSGKDIKACACPHPNSASSSRSSTKAPTSSPLCDRLVPILERVAASWEIVFVDDGSRTTRSRRSAARNADGAAHRRGLVQPQLRQGDRHRGRPRPRARARRRDHGRRPPASAGDDRALRRALARGLRHGLRPAHRPLGREPRSSAASRACSTACSTASARCSLPEGAGDFRLIDRKGVEVLRGAAASGPASRRGSMPGSASSRSACPSRSRSAGTARRSGASASCSASPSTASPPSRPCRCGSGPISAASSRCCSIAAAVYFVVRTLLFGTDVAGYPSLIVSVMFFSRHAAHVARHHRRVYRPHLRRGEAPAALCRRRADRRAPRLRSPRSSATSVAPPRGRDRMLKKILSVGGWTLVSRVTGFVRDVVIAAVMGVGPVADAFVVALRLPNHFRAIFGEGAFNSAFVPTYARGARDERARRRRSSSPTAIFTLMLIVQLGAARGGARRHAVGRARCSRRASRRTRRSSPSR